MPLKIVRNDITKMQVDAIVNTANSKPLYSTGVDTAVYEAAGAEEPIALEYGEGTVDELVALGRVKFAENSSLYFDTPIDPNVLALLVFTSGTTGKGKGVMLSQKNILSDIAAPLQFIDFTFKSVGVLPPHHTFGSTVNILGHNCIGCEVYISSGIRYVQKPEHLVLVPLYLETFYRKIMANIKDQGKEKLIARMIKISNFLRKIGIDLRKKLFKSVTSNFGGELEMIICGGAPLSQETVDFLSNIGIDVYNGYGITECSPVVAVNPLCEIRKNSVGHILPTMEVRIDSPDENGNGEIQLFGDNVMKGYYKADEDTSKVFTEDGWFRTGDIGYTDSDNFLYISGRLKNLIILPNGKNVFPEEIEEALMKKIPCIKECVVYADEENTGIYALIYPDSDICAGSGAETAGEIKEYIRPQLDAFNSEMPAYKRIADFFITDKEFEKSTTHKIQRFKIAAVNK